MIAGKSEEIRRIFNELLKSSPDIKGFILVSYEGLVMVSTFETDEAGMPDEAISAMAAGINSFIARFLQNLRWDSYSNILISNSKEYILIKDIEGVGLLVTLIKIRRKRIHTLVNDMISTIKSLDTSDK